MSSARCGICPRQCVIPENGTGFCGVRENQSGQAVYAAYGKVSAIALDPIEKKPLYMFRPGSKILSVGGFGCNLRCPFCQNSAISMEYDMAAAQTATPAQIAGLALKTVPDGNIGVAYTYNEPLIGYEFVFDCAKLIHGAGLANVLVTNGTVNPAPLEALLPYIDAMNIDLKAFSDAFYKKLGGSLETVKDVI
ncbi:MAG: radical SAM protein, partial [Oscillospiraceae bacterium]|nr:radical SAM protein [Oscillospiraceae bacterium]